MRKALLSVASALVLLPGPRANAAGWLIPPVDAVIAQAFEAPATDYAPGHRGIDYDVEPGTRVRAAGDGVVTFAGPVAGVNAVTILHDGDLETTYSDLAQVSVAEGQSVDTGMWIGTSGQAHPGEPGLHFGLKIGGEYVDPVLMLGPVDVAAAIHLAPVYAPPSGLPDAARRLFPRPARSAPDRPCRPLHPMDTPAEPPNDNIAVAVAGIGSHTAGTFKATMYENGPETLGYPPDRVYRFSYRGADGPDLHVPYSARDTFGDLSVAASRLGDLLHEIARAHPGVAVDVLAHSQGGIVARRALERYVDGWPPEIPRVEHFITFSSPHEGAPAAAAIGEFRSGLLGRVITAATHRIAGDRVPDPYSVAVHQLEPGSDLIEDLAREDVSFGTRFLALATAQDPVVPANVALPEGAVGRVVPLGLRDWPTAHDSVVGSPLSRAIAYDFLRDGPQSCTGESDALGPDVGAGISWLERELGSLGRVFESSIRPWR